MSFHWTNLISLNSSQNDAFEELLCQLAKKEPIQAKKEFIKVGNPDGGLECYIVLENGDELGFQAKWFLSSPQDAQWNQIEKSFKTALKKHPKMIKYYVAIPLDRADPRNDKSHFMDKWHEKVEKWKQFALDTHGKEIEFNYWGSSELIERLSREENGGLKKFFFGEIDLSKKWLKNQNELAIKDLGARYTPEISIKLDSILENFDAISRNEQFKKRVNKAYHEFMISYREFASHIRFENEEINKLNSELSRKLESFEKIYELIDFSGVEYIDIGTIIQLFEEVQPLSRKISDLLYELNEKEIEDKKIKTRDGYRASTKYDSNIRDLRDYLSELYETEGLFQSKSFKFINNPFMILNGEAGIGKSHLLADIVTQRMNEGYDSIFLLGQQFRSEVHPWSQILKDLLRLDCNEWDFLGALNAKAETQNRRITIFIDAINEGKGRNFWNNSIVGFIESIKQYEWLGLVLSIRSSYFDLIIPKEILEQELAIKVTHYGFDGVEYNASKLFFNNYNIAQPSIPLLHPEFSNPLFLKLFCEGLNKKGLTTIPDGYEGITSIIKFFIEGVEAKLEYKYPNIKSLKLIDKVIKALIEKMIDVQTVAYDEAFSIVEKTVAKYRLQSGLLYDLISEGLLAKNLLYNNEYIYFTYERFEDHLKVKFLFDTYLDKGNPKSSFEKEPLKDYFDIDNVYSYRGIIDAMSIQLPEYCRVELIDMVPQNEFLIESFFDSLAWRGTRCFTDKAFEHIEKIQNDWEGISSKYLEVVLQLSAIPNHPLNILYFHQKLLGMTMLQRDYEWSIQVHNLFIEDKIVKRIINWAWDKKEEFEIENKSLHLYGLTLGWFLTSSNRELRDGATKALVNLFTDRVDVFLQALKEFESVNDLYILERLYAVGYGIVLRSSNQNGFRDLGEYIYRTIFNRDAVVEHILLRDYAKLIIKYIDSIFGLDIEMSKVLPPYGSSMPSGHPDYEETKKYGDTSSAFSSIVSSMRTERLMPYGDFGRYTFQSALAEFHHEDFDIQDLSNYACNIIFEEYITDKDLFLKAENEMKGVSHQRNEHKVERIGKKYQWIAMYKVLAKIADNYQIKDVTNGDNDLAYSHASTLGIRNIDITSILKERNKHEYQWGHRINDDFENIQLSDKKWICSKDKLPTFYNIVNVHEDERDYLVLDTYFSKDGSKEKNEYRNITYSIYAYIVKKDDFEDILDWLEEQDFYDNDIIAESRSISPVFLREYPHSKVYDEINQDYYGQNNWDRGHGHRNDILPHKVLLSSTQYSKENTGYDASLSDNIHLKLPNKWLVDSMKLKQSLHDGTWYNNDGKIIFFDPSAESYCANGSAEEGILLADKELLLQFLDNKGYTIFWTLNGEKMMRETDYTQKIEKEFIGYGAISGYAYFNNEEFIENIDIRLDNGRG